MGKLELTRQLELGSISPVNGGKAFCSVEIGTRVIYALVDTGASITCIKNQVLQSGRPGIEIIKTKVEILAANQSKINVLGYINSHLCVFHQDEKDKDWIKLTHPFSMYVCEDIGQDMIIGLDFLRRYQGSIDVANKNLVIKDRNRILKLPLHFSISEIRDKKSKEHEKFSINTLGLSSEQKQVLHINEELSSTQKSALFEILDDNCKAFAWKISQLGQSKLEPFKINVDLNNPVAEKFYRKSIQESKIIRDQVKELLDAGIIRPSKSAWGSNPLVVQKRTAPGAPRQYRMVVSYKAVNKVTPTESFEMPDIETILHSLNGSRYFTKVDMMNGYFQIPMVNEYIPVTAFYTEEQLYEYTVMPFGLKNAPSHFVRCMRDCLNDLIWKKYVVLYMDDILVPGHSFENMLMKLDAVLKRLIEFNLTIKPSKCFFALREVPLLGHVVSYDGVSCDPEKLSAIKLLPPPRKIRELRSFLGNTGYYRKFVRNYSAISKPLTDLLRKDVPYVWGPEQQEAFEALKATLVSPPILAHFDENLPVEILTDASGLGIGSVLCQTHEGKRRPIAYASRTLTDAETRYHSVELECLAVLFAIAKFRHYIWERKFTVVTDCHALCALTKLKTPGNARLVRWQLRLQSLDFDIVYETGNLNHMPDCLSRLPVHFPTKEDEEDEFELFSLTAKDGLSFLREEQRKDPYLSKICEEITEKPRKNYLILEGLLYYQKPTDQYPRICIPDHLVDDLIRDLHDQPLLGHTSSEKTMERVRTRYHFPKLQETVEKYVKSCLSCQMRKPPPEGTYGKIKNVFCEELNVFDLVSIDFCGPFPVSLRGNIYIVAAIDYKTRYIVAKAVRDATSKTAARFVIEELICKFGVPKRILSDNGPCFTANFYQEINRGLGANPIYSSSYHPMGHGLIERVFRTVQDILAKYVAGNQKSWCKYLQPAIFAMNSSVQKSLKYSPFFLMYGREPNLPVDVLHDRKFETPDVEDQIQKMKQVHDFAASNLRKALEGQTQIKDQNYKEKEFQIDDLVMVHIKVLLTGQSKKLSMFWHGPYIITKKHSVLNYTITPLFPGKKQKELFVHIHRLKPFHMSVPFSKMFYETEDGSNSKSGGATGQNTTRQITEKFKNFNEYQDLCNGSLVREEPYTEPATDLVLSGRSSSESEVYSDDSDDDYSESERRKKKKGKRIKETKQKRDSQIKDQRGQPAKIQTRSGREVHKPSRFRD